MRIRVLPASLSRFRVLKPHCPQVVAAVFRPPRLLRGLKPYRSHSPSPFPPVRRPWEPQVGWGCTSTSLSSRWPVFYSPVSDLEINDAHGQSSPERAFFF